MRLARHLSATSLCNKASESFNLLAAGEAKQKASLEAAAAVPMTQPGKASEDPVIAGKTDADMSRTAQACPVDIQTWARS